MGLGPGTGSNNVRWETKYINPASSKCFQRLICPNLGVEGAIKVMFPPFFVQKYISTGQLLESF